MTAYTQHQTGNRSSFGKDRSKALKAYAPNLTIDEWASIKRGYSSGVQTIVAARAYRLSRLEVEILAQYLGDTLSQIA